MEGPQELLSGKLQLCFTPAARASLLLLRLNDAALRALQECHQQQVRLARAPSSLSPAYPEVGSQPATPAKEPGGGEQHRRALASPTLQVKPGRQVPRPRAPDAGSWGRRFCCSWLKSVLCPQVRPVIAFQGNRGYLRLPGPHWSCLFSFIVSQCGQEGPGGPGLDLVCQRLGRSGPNRLHCLGPLRGRLTIWAAMDSIPAPSSVQRHNRTEDARDRKSWQNVGDYPEGDTISQSQMALEEVPDPLASSQGQSLPGSSREHVVQWEVRNQTLLPNRDPDQALPPSASQKHVDKKRSAPAATVELKQKRLRTLAPSPLQGLPSQDLQEEDWEQEDKDEDMGPRLEHSPSVQADSESPSPEEVPDYLLQYRAIHSAEQQHAYEQDFETDYAEYRLLHARVGAASQRFIELAAEMNNVQRGTPEHKALEEKIVQEYKKFRKRYPGYREEKRRCEYLHQKLSHIKGLILEFEEKNRGS
ncbi:RNA polymerase II elongation factor ELL3 isoform X1 [Oryx dammah]|uniref:RNA polymerase II elongation factor ELL3 isoform X1 n=1 Tax=Oryx dammah TaxID=59534 RepID=UPI001A9AB1F2|nr:RNA polymerase II elongation factor ELL3 isoform X1 [Oryx dammah]